MSKSAQIRDLYEANPEITVAEVADKVGVRYQFAYNVIRRLCDQTGEEVRKANPITTSSQIREMAAEGMTPGKIAKALNANYAFVHQVVKKYKEQMGIIDNEEAQVS